MLGWRRAVLPVKTPDQIRVMRRAGLVVRAALDEVNAALEPGITTGQLNDLAASVISGHAAAPSFLGYYGFPGVICVSVNDEVVHGIPGSRVLEAGDLVSVDCGAIVDGWHGDAAFTAIVGGDETGRPQDRELNEVTEASMWDGIRALRDGERLHAVGAAIQDRVEAEASARELSLGILDGYTGHGIGTEMHQEPSVYNERVRERGPLVRTGATVAIEPMITLGTHQSHELDDEWTVVTQDGSRGSHWENTIAVTEGGLWVLTEVDGGEAHLGERYAPLD
ncbi:type I methionyl aminopeptidase [Demetria terragena]|uniref:type I methionyl aminopeptidase n=1 Tax=Demetria terragena TaxID=63959 RepID=UPI000477D07F|nr:type I methionyl aminopeptidase [Demetria terragena]